MFANQQVIQMLGILRKADAPPSAMNALDDAALLRHFRQGHEPAFREIMSRYESPLLGYLINFTGCPEQGRDLCQDTFLKLINKPPSMLSGGKLKAWLFRVARNLALDAARKRKHDRNALDIDSISETLPGESEDEHLVPSDAARLREHLNALPENLREVVTLRIYSELKFEEIAKHCEIPLGTALWRMRRALELLKTALEKEGELS